MNSIERLGILWSDAASYERQPLQPVKRFIALFSLAFVGFGALAPAQQLPVGTLSENVDFALLGGGLSNSQLTDYSGRIVVLYYYTPW